MNEEHGPPIGGRPDSLVNGVVFLLYYNSFTRAAVQLKKLIAINRTIQNFNQN